MRSRRSHLTLLIGTLALLTLGLSVASAQQVMSWNLFNGQPAIQITSEPLYYVWFDQGGWHVRWSTLGPSLFSGQVVTTTGQFTDVRSQAQLGSWVVNQGGRVVFLNGTIGSINGFDFKTTGPSDTLTFSLMHNQRLIPPQQVIVGSGSVRASAMPFTVTSVPVFPAAAAGTSTYDPVDRVSGPGEGK